MSFWLALLLLAGTAFALFARSDAELSRRLGLDSELFAGIQPQEAALLVAGLAIVVFVVPGVFGAYRGRAGRAFRDLISWSVIAIGAIGGYNYREEIGQIAYRIAGEFGTQPVSQQSLETTANGEKSVRIRRRKDGHFVATVTVNGNSVPMLVDTGASTVVLRQADARKLGIDTTSLKFTVPVQTANGIAYAAHLRLRNVMIGSIALAGVDALVAQPGALKESLLGMTFLSRLRSYEFSGQYLTFRN